MGHREHLLAGAKRCLYERGYARTTARDIVAASGTNLASIGYHFGGKQELLNAALVDATREWMEALERIVPADMGRDSLERFESTWNQIIELFASHRALWVAHFEALVEAERCPEVREFFAMAEEGARAAMVMLFEKIEGPDIDKRAMRTVGSFHVALLLGVMAQHLLEPKFAPSGRDLADALRAIVQGCDAGSGKTG